jgi:hypothetical protein
MTVKAFIPKLSLFIFRARKIILRPLWKSKGLLIIDALLQPRTLASMNNLALLNDNQGILPKSYPLYIECLKMS